MEQYERRTNIQINNLPEIANEDMLKVVSEMGSKIGVPLVMNVDIQAAHRVPSMNPNIKNLSL